MTSSEFINKFKSKYLWGNIGAMILVLVLLCVGVKYGIDIYTHHGEAIRVPDIRYKNIDDATHILDDAGLEIVVTDTGYVRSLPPDVILEHCSTNRVPALSLPISPCVIFVYFLHIHSLSTTRRLQMQNYAILFGHIKENM